MHGTLPILYTFPAIYGLYLSFAFPEEDRCLQGLPIWIARTYRDGGEALHDVRALKQVDEFVQRLCRIQAGNRCLVHQYTHRGIFMASVPARGAVPQHFDLDRFYTSKIVENSVGPQHVRVEDPFR